MVIIFVYVNCLQFVFQHCDFLLPNILKVVGEIRPITEELVGRTLCQGKSASLGGEVIEAHCLQEEITTLAKQLMQLGNRLVSVSGKLFNLRLERLLVITGGAQHQRCRLLTGCIKGKSINNCLLYIAQPFNSPVNFFSSSLI